MKGISVREALASIRGAKLRSFLTMIAVIVGVMSFILVTTLVEGLKSSVVEQIDEYGGNLVQITKGKSVIRDDEGNIDSFNLAAQFAQATLTEEDLKYIKSLEGVSAAAPFSLITASATRGDIKLETPLIISTNEDFLEALNYTLETGSFFSDKEEGDESRRNVVVIGQKIVEELFAGTVSLGSSIDIKGQSFTIIGVVDQIDGGLGFGPDLNTSILLPLDSASELTNTTILIDEIDIQVNQEADVDALIADIEGQLLKNHKGEEDFTVLKQDEIISVTNNIFDLVKDASQVISYIMLFVGGIVIMLIMLITVKERTREIGIRKSIGATNNNILMQFMTEAVVLTWLGGIFGFAFAFGLGLIISTLIDLTPVYSLNTLLVVGIISTGVGVVAGVWPAFQAARKDPIESLRHE